jgi:NADH dehydrogenase
LLERLEDVAPSFPPKFRTAVREELDAAGVSVRTGQQVEAVTADAVRTSARQFAYDQLVWTGGIRGASAMEGDRPEVRATLAVDDRTFVVGDAGRVVDAEGEAVPASAQAAVREARTAATNIERVVGALRDGAPRPRLERFTFDSPGWVVSVGDGAVAQVGPAVLGGRAARAVKGGVGASYLATTGSPRSAIDLLREEL